MFDSMHMNMPVVIALIALLVIVVAGGLFVGVRLMGQRAVENEQAGQARRPPRRP